MSLMSHLLSLGTIKTYIAVGTERLRKAKSDRFYKPFSVILKTQDLYFKKNEKKRKRRKEKRGAKKK